MWLLYNCYRIAITFNVGHCLFNGIPKCNHIFAMQELWSCLISKVWSMFIFADCFNLVVCLNLLLCPISFHLWDMFYSSMLYHYIILFCTSIEKHNICLRCIRGEDDSFIHCISFFEVLKSNLRSYNFSQYDRKAIRRKVELKGIIIHNCKAWTKYCRYLVTL